MLRFLYFLLVWVVPVCTRAYEYEYSSADSRDLASTTFSSVECDLHDALIGQVIYDEVNDVFREPVQAEETLGCKNSIPVKECSCASGPTKQYCSANFNTCRVQRDGAVFCFANETLKLEVARGVWPFCLFWFAVLFYLWVASEPGRRARSYLRRHATNGVVHLKSVFLGDPTTTTTTTATATSLDSPEVYATSTQQENDTQEGAPNAAAQEEEMDMQNRVDSTLTSTLTLTSGDNVSANDDEEAPNTSQSDNADYPASRARAIAASSEPLPEFGSRSNYQQLLQELYQIHRYESERMLLLWHSAWYREQSQYENNPHQQQQQEDTHNPIRSTATPWLNSRRTAKLALRTKRYEKSAENGDEEANGGEEHQNDANSQEEGRGTNSCAICLVEIEEGDIVGDIPCHHVFHKECLKSWLQRSNRCPLCQQEGIASPRRPSLRPPEANSGADGTHLESSRR
jgi:hypothetical protein